MPDVISGLPDAQRVKETWIQVFRDLKGDFQRDGNNAERIRLSRPGNALLES